jgi:hypothetical protein
LDTLDMQIDWLGVPDNLHAHYRGYKDYEDPLKDPASPITNNLDFKAQLRLYDNRALFDIAEVKLFHANAGNTTGATATNDISIDGAAIKTKYPNYRQDLRPIIAEEVLDWSRYWQLELLEPDFQHAIYPHAAAGCANKVTDSTSTTTPPETKPKPVLVNPPYTPEDQAPV